MGVIDRDGVEWVTIAEAADRLGVAEATIRSWRSRRRASILGHLIDGRLYVPWPEVARVERATRGRYLTQRRQQRPAPQGRTYSP